VSVAVAPRTLIDSDNGVRQKGLSIQHQKRLLMAYFAINMMRLTIGLLERCQLIAVSMRGMIQYPALSHGRALPNQYTPHLHQPLNHQIQLEKFNIWAICLVVYEL